MSSTFYCWTKLHIISFLLKELPILLIMVFSYFEVSLSTPSSLKYIRNKSEIGSSYWEQYGQKSIWALVLEIPDEISNCVSTWGTEMMAYSLWIPSNKCSFLNVVSCQCMSHAWTISEMLYYEINLTPWIIVPFLWKLIPFADSLKGSPDVGKAAIFSEKNQGRVLVPRP